MQIRYHVKLSELSITDGYLQGPTPDYHNSPNNTLHHKTRLS